MNEKFDELAKSLAQSVTRRVALKKFSLSLAGIALASLGLVKKAEADPRKHWHCNCKKAYWGCDPNNFDCMAVCGTFCSP